MSAGHNRLRGAVGLDNVPDRDPGGEGTPPTSPAATVKPSASDSGTPSMNRPTAIDSPRAAWA
jgi:hypothetical protein